MSLICKIFKHKWQVHAVVHTKTKYDDGQNHAIVFWRCKRCGSRYQEGYCYHKALALQAFRSALIQSKSQPWIEDESLIYRP